MKTIHILGGGTFNHVRPHLALAAPAFGTLSRMLAAETLHNPKAQGHVVHLHPTRMAAIGRSEEEHLCDLAHRAEGVGFCLDTGYPVTNDQVAELLDLIVQRPDTKIVFLTAALCDYEGSVVENEAATASGKQQPRLQSRGGPAIA